MAELPINEIVNKDWIEAAKGLPDRAVHTIITSPPYW
jgi:DNA modification methylase